MPSRPRSPVRALAHAVGVAVTVLAVTGLVGGCSSPPPPATAPGRFAAEVDLSDQTLTVGGKEFAEQQVLCKMTIALLQSARATVVDRCDTPGSSNVRALLTGGQIDMYWEYTGTAWRTHLAQESSLPDPRALYDAVRLADAGNQVNWLDPTPFNDTYAIGVCTDIAQRLGVRTVSDFARLVRAGDPAGSLCVAQEFTGREDGLQGLLRVYGFELANGRLDTRDTDAIYPALAATNPCTFGEVFATDGRINPLRLTTLVDDRGYFLPYNAALSVRTDVMTRAPRLALLGRMLSPGLTDSVMRGLNERVSVGGRTPDEVARAYLREQGLIG